MWWLTSPSSRRARQSGNAVVSFIRGACRLAFDIAKQPVQRFAVKGV